MNLRVVGAKIRRLLHAPRHWVVNHRGVRFAREYDVWVGRWPFHRTLEIGCECGRVFYRAVCKE